MPPNEECPSCHQAVADWHIEWYKAEGPRSIEAWRRWIALYVGNRSGFKGARSDRPRPACRS